MIFFDINVQSLKSWNDDFMYLHAYWHRDTATTIARDYEILPGKSQGGDSWVPISALFAIRC